VPPYSMSCPLPAHLKRLEAESVGIIREVAAEFRRPVLLYSIGKDSSEMLHLALKAFYPGKPPFPLLHVDTTWKFRDMIRFRDEVANKLGLDLIVHVKKEGLARGINPFTSGSAHFTGIDSLYETPDAPELSLLTTQSPPPQQLADEVIAFLEESGYLQLRS
jgi:sulfate adenylyltransferase subunit 2